MDPYQNPYPVSMFRRRVRQIHLALYFVDTEHCSQASLASQSILPGGLPRRFLARRPGPFARISRREHFFYEIHTGDC